MGTLILAVDDHPVNRLMMLKQLQSLGYGAESAEDGASALQLWRSGRFAAVITDCHMPEMDGFDLARAIRQEERTRGMTRIPVIACTSTDIDGETEDCLAAGMDDCLAKPVDIQDLLRKLDRWVPLPARAGAPAINPELMALVHAGKKTQEHGLMVEYRSLIADDIEFMRRGLDARDGRAVQRAAHRVLGASHMIGAGRVAGVCRQLERAGRDGDWSLIATLEPGFFDEMERLRLFLDTV